MAMMGFEEETILEENQLEKLNLRRVKKLKNGKAEKVRMRSQKRG